MALTRRAFGMGLLGAVSAPALAQSARAQSNDVELLLVLLNDGSGSIDPEEYKLQREGTAVAIEHPRVVQSIMGMRLGAIAVAYGEWGSPGAPRLILPWTRIASAADAADFADRLVAAPREFQSYNAIGDALTMATDLIRVAPFRAQRATIDLAGDGPDMRSHTPASVARDRAVALGITINALAIQAEGSGQAMRTGPLRDFYEANVIGGPGAFVATAKDRQDFAYAIFNKLIREIS